MDVREKQAAEKNKWLTLRKKKSFFKVHPDLPAGTRLSFNPPFGTSSKPAWVDGEGELVAPELVVLHLSKKGRGS